MKTVYLGSGGFGIECLNALFDSDNGVEFIVTGSAQPAGRGRKPQPTKVACWAKNHSIPFIEADNVNRPEIFERIAAFAPQLIVVIAFGQKIGNRLIELPPKGAVNIHASLLPKYRGAAPINWAIIDGESQTGISIITLAEKMDAGAVLAQAKTEIAPDETAGQLHDRLARIAGPLLLRTIRQIADGTVVYKEQDHSMASLAPKLKKSDGFLDFSESADVLRRKILGFWPWPGASAFYISKKTSKSQRVTIAMAQMILSPAELPPGTLDENLNVVCGSGALKITKIKPAGASVMDFKDFVNGRATRPGDLFVKIDK